MAKPRVPSSQVVDAAKQGDDLIVTYKGGTKYGYQGAAHHEQPLLNDQSPGAYLHREIKKPMVKDASGNMVLKYPAVKL